jgi:FKBP-type peptidyl-prolyl cis-trans isomerase FklB
MIISIYCILRKDDSMMKSVWAILTAIMLLNAQGWAAEEMTPKTPKDKLSYTLGVNAGQNLQQQAIDIDPEMFARGLKDAMTGAKITLTDEEMLQIIMAFQKEAMEKQTLKMKEIAEKNKKIGEDFLAENKKKEGVKTLPSGLQYKIIKNGKGKLPKLTDKVTANYRGTLINGTEFDNSYKRGQPVKFPVNGVIPGWTEALKMMKAGSKWQLFVPPQLAYGEQGAGAIIGPNETLIFEIELLAIN